MEYVSYIAITPFITGTIIAIFYLLSQKKVKISQTQFALMAVVGPIISAILGIRLFFDVMANKEAVIVKAFSWITVGDFMVDVSFYVDTLSALMTLFVTFIAALIHIYSIGYMDKDEGFGKFFSYMNLFLGSMLILVLADNPVLMFVGWEGVGACSYLLIAYYYDDKENVKAGNKAFIMNRIGDFAFIIGILILFVLVGEHGFSFPSLMKSSTTLSVGIIGIITLFLFIGATGKSAQIPLYTWLPDAMAGPTPVSALIHAATMVTAGVYMIARFSFLYSTAPLIGEIIAYVGAFTALLAAIIATKQDDIKKILAYSTVSQLGYMFVAVGLGAYSTGIFHVFTHAFFKALLFLGAGAVIYALHHEQNIFKMSNLKGIKSIYIPMLLSTLAISGIPPFAGFFSKDEILLKIFESGNYFIYAIALVTAGLTAYYMFRLFFVVFHYKEVEHKIHKPPFIMTSILWILAIGAVFAGFVGLPEIFGGENMIKGFLSSSLTYSQIEHHHVSHSTEYILMSMGTGISVVGILVAFKKYFRFVHISKSQDSVFVKYIKNKFYVDEFYTKVFVENLKMLSIFIYKYLDQVVIANAVYLSAIVVKGISIGYGNIIQNGKVRFYGFYMLALISVISFYMNRFIGG